MFKCFAEESKFDVFFEQNQSFYAKCIDVQKAEFSRFSIPKFMNEFYGDFVSNKKYFCCLTFVDCTSGGHGLMLNGDFYPIMNVSFENDEEMYPLAPSVLVHEMSHPIINPLNEKYLNKDMLTIKAKRRLEQQTHHSWFGAINEYMIRSIEFLAYASYMTDERQKKWIDRNKRQGFLQIDEIIELFKRDCKKLKNIENEFPLILKDVLKIVDVDKRLEKK